jgi:hypothetical protein
MTHETYTCSSCGKEHAGLPTDWGFKLPDDIFSLSHLEKYSRTRTNADLCTLDENRFFMRGLLPIRFTHQTGEFSWGIWVEVSRETHDFYLQHYYDDMSESAPAKGVIANNIAAYADLVSEPVEIRFQNAKDRPEFYLLANSKHSLANEQRIGIDLTRHHNLLEAIGYFEADTNA